MTSLSFAETKSTLQGENQVAAASGSTSGISGMIHYRFNTLERWAWYSQFTFPLIASQGTYFSGGGGLEYNWGKAPAKMTLNDGTTSFILTPITRYFALVGINMGYLAYLTPTAKKNDTLLEIDTAAGLSKKIGKYDLRAQAGVSRGVGIATNTIGLKVMLGCIFFLD